MQTRSAADVRGLLVRVREAADLAGVTPNTICQTLFGNFRLPARLARQAELIEARAAKLDAHIALLKARSKP
jgi:hypothetical protein